MVKSPAPSTTPTTLYTPSSIIQEVDNRLISNNVKHTETEANVKPLSKLDIIKKFDNKLKSEKIEDIPVSTPKTDYVILDDVRDGSIETVEDLEQESAEDQLAALDAQQLMPKNGHSAENGSNGASGTVPPKPLPRTSRTNSVSSVSSLSSDLGFVMIGDEITPRPVAKPRTTATSYKVHQS